MASVPGGHILHPMKEKSFAGGWPTRLILIGVLGSLFTVGILQYRWMLQSAEGEGERQFRSLMTTVSRTMAGEFQRVAASSRPARLESLESEDFKAAIEEIYHASGYSDEPDPVITALGLLRGEEEYTYYDGSGWSPGGAVPEELLPVIRRWVDRRNEDRPEFFFLYNHEFPLSSSYILRTLPETPERAIIIEMEISRFLRRYLLPALNESLPDFSVTYTTEKAAAPGFNNREDTGEQSQGRRYRFSPWKALLAPQREEEKYYIPLGSGQLMLSDEKDDKRFPFQGVVRPFALNEGERQSGGALVIESLGVSLLRQAERRVALNWLLSQFLLVGVGGAFTLMLFQGHRLKTQRRREREFVAAITHELRTPLSVLQSAADNIKEGIVPARRLPRYGELMTTQVHRLSEMIEGLLLFSRLEGKAEQPGIIERITPDELETRLRERIPPEEGGASRGRVSFDFGALPERFPADREGLDLILGNLLTNALIHAYPEEGPIRILGRCTLPNKLHFTVEDDGRGVPPREQRKLFSPFFRGEKSREEQIKGSGLGLHLSARKARLMGGRLTLESPYERLDGRRREGCRFTLSLPYQPQEDRS